MGLFVKKIEAKTPSDSSPVVLLHGFCEDQSMWENILPILEHRAVYLVDLPGFGQSAMALPDALSIDWVAETIYQQLILTEKIVPILIGHSLGGYVALALAEKYPNHLNGFCLFHSTVFADSPEKKETRNKVIDFVKNSGVKAYTSQSVPGLFHSTFRRANPGQVQRVVDLAGTTREETVTAYAGAMRDRPDRSHLLKTFDGLKLVIAGEKDGAVPLEQSLLMEEMIDSDRFVILEGVAHMGMYEKPEACKKALSSLL